MVRLVLALALLPVALAIESGGAFAQAASRQHVAVVCASAAGGPWTQKALGTLTRTKRSDRELVYTFKGAGQTFEWRFVTSPQGNTTVSGPGFLMERFGAVPKGAPSQHGRRRQSVEATGEIRESAGPASLALLIRTDCPGGPAR
ncbi:MAG TPA: hypothetical protein VGF58_05415 [Burkholderiales bacterium]|jgi:hypothetical protein